jgi:hypothetical protein
VGGAHAVKSPQKRATARVIERRAGMSRETLAITRAALGLTQGAALYLLYNAADAKVWPATDAQLFAPLVLTAVFIPSLALVGLGNLRLRTFAVWIAAATIITAALGAYDIFHDPAGGVFGASRGSPIVPSPPLWLAAAAGLAITHTLILSGDADRVWIARYTRYFDIGWKHAVQVALAGAFVGALWVLLLLGATLFRLIGIGFFEELLWQKAWFGLPITTLAFAVAIHVTDVQAGIVRGVRTLALTLLSWLLPLFTLIALGFLAALLFTGLEPLWSTRRATGLVLATAAALIVLINAAYQDGTREQPVAFILRCAGIGAAAALVPLVAIAAYAVMLRVSQYGWTPERVIATAGIVVAACYALGYAAAAIASRSWLRGIEMTNLVTAIVALAVILALFSPVADPARIAVADQVARLETGRIPVDQVDFVFLRFHGGRYGLAALDRLRQKQDGPDAARIARDFLDAESEYDARRRLAPEVPNPAPTPAERAANIAVVYPKGQSLPAAFLQQDWAAPPDQWRHPYCMTIRWQQCDALMLDLDGDGAAEILISDLRGRFIAYKETPGKWLILGYLENSDCPRVREALLAGNFELAAPELKEIKAAGRTIPAVLKVAAGLIFRIPESTVR